jgi:hypothetical protein
MSGEAFGSGRYGDEKHYNTNNNNNPNSSIVWYKRKALAEHGAAARAFDCLVFREGRAAGIPGSTMAAWAAFRIGKDEPYMASAATPKTSNSGGSAAALAVPSHVPSHLRAKVEEMIRQGQAHMAHVPPPTIQGKDGNDDDNVEEAAWKSNAYEQQHDRQRQQQSSQQYGDQVMQQNEFDKQKAIFGDP